MFHVGGLNVQTTPAFHSGATVVLHAVFDPAAALASIARDRPTLFVNVPATMQAIRAQPDFDKTDFSSVRMMSTGSTTVPLPIVKAYQDKGVRVGQVYGLTETAPLAVVSLGIEGPDKFGSTGKAALHCEARIVDDEGNDLPPGEAGEILIKGPNVMTEYWNNPEATAAALRDGWLHTGDVARCDEDGYYWIVDRKKDVIISGSENIYPAELEGVLAECTELSEWAVVGRPDDKWGEVPIAAVVRAPGSTIDDTGVLALFENTLARYKHPRGVVFLDALPRNAMGKILKQEVRELVKE
jgi:fatty-acyl-CoA synthase